MCVWLSLIEIVFHDKDELQQGIARYVIEFMKKIS
jgi:hypothetical protein